MRLGLSLIITVCLYLPVSAQNKAQLGINYAKIARSQNDTIKANGLNALAKYHVNADQDSAWYYLEGAEKLSNALAYKRGIAYSALTRGILESDRGNFPEALENILKASDLAEETKDYHLLAGCKLNLGNFYIRNGEVDKGISTYREGLKVCQDHHIVYTEASLYTSIGMGLKLKGEIDSAIYYYEKVLEIHYTQLHDSVIIAAIYNNMAAAVFDKKDYQTCENYLLKSYEINERMGNQRYMILNLSNLGELAGLQKGNLDRSMNYFDQALKMSKQLKSKEFTQSVYEGMGNIYYENGKYKEAYEYYRLSVAYKDSLFGDQQSTRINEISQEYQTRHVRDSLRIKDQELELSKKNEEAAVLQASKSTWQLIGASVLIVLVLVVLFFVNRNAKIQKRNNTLLYEKNMEIQLQKEEIELKNTELTDSIQYAKRIQDALLPSPSYLSKTLGEHFLIFRPKDIVSGDFYWVKQSGNRHMFAIADCTGHGVPGAMVSMLGFETIEKASSHEFNQADQFMNLVNDTLISTLNTRNKDFQSDDTKVKDGMDLALCIVSNRQKLSFCGANNECYILRPSSNPLPAAHERLKIYPGDKYNLIELKPTKRPVGLFDSAEEFKAVELDLLQGDKFYLFSDGYADQFGGEKGKKMKTSVFRDALIASSSLTMHEQKKFLENHLSQWQGNFDQLDDITVLGVLVE